jgi:uncharacterized protein YodC (DUF2158 family)
MMADTGGVQKNTAYGVFVQACWAQHKRQYPDELIHKEIEEFNKQCSVWWYNLSEGERDRFQEMADRSNAQQAALNQLQVNNINAGGAVIQNTNPDISSFGTSFHYSDFPVQGQGQVVNTVVDNNQLINYSTNAGQVQVVRQVQQQQHQVGGQIRQGQVIMNNQIVQNNDHILNTNSRPFNKVQKVNQKPMKDPNAPKKPLSAYFLFSSDERLKVKGTNPEMSITEVAKELGKRWATLDPAVKSEYERRYHEARKEYDIQMNQFKPQKKKKDPNAPKQPLSAYFIFSTEERLKVKENNPSYTICDVAKELGRRWADMDKSTKDRYQARAEEERQKYDVEMAAYRQNNLNAQTALANAASVASSSVPGGVTVVSTATGQVVVSQPVQSINTSLSSSQQQHAVSYATIQHQQPTVTKVESGGGGEYSNLLH